MKFMATLRFRPEDRAEINAHVPQEQEQVRVLRQQGVVEAIYVAADGSPVWIVMQAESQDKAHESLQTLPLYPFMDIEYTSLL